MNLAGIFRATHLLDSRRCIAGLLALGLVNALPAHPETIPPPKDRALVDGSRSAGGPVTDNPALLRVTLETADTHQLLDGLLRITPADEGAPVALGGLFERPAGWFSAPAKAEIKLAPGRYRIEATHGTDYAVTTEVVDCRAGAPAGVTLGLRRIYDAAAHQLHSANTHLHLLLHSGAKVGVDLDNRQAADGYLSTVGASDGLNLVYVSYLGAPGAQIISNEYTDADLRALSRGPTIFTNAVEHRHGGVRVKLMPAAPAVERNKIYPLDSTIVSLTYGHVLLLDLAKRSMVASVGPGLSDDSRVTDGVPLRDGIQEARRQGGAIVWCHGTMGTEEIPDWFSGLIHAQNIYDGGNEGTFETVYYPYLNAGLKVPFSTGTDWGITDFSRVYVAAPGDYTSKVFLGQLTAGRTFITNEPFLEFSADGAAAGDTLAFAKAGTVHVRGRAVGRSDFIRVQLVANGIVLGEAASVPVDGHFEATLEGDFPVAESGWLALRVTPVRTYEYRSKYAGPGTNIFGKAIFAHTSPIYVTVAGRPVLRRDAVEVLLARVKAALGQIDEMGTFANDAERAGIRKIYLETEASLAALRDRASTP